MQKRVVPSRSVCDTQGMVPKSTRQGPDILQISSFFGHEFLHDRFPVQESRDYILYQQYKNKNSSSIARIPRYSPLIPKKSAVALDPDRTARIALCFDPARIWPLEPQHPWLLETLHRRGRDENWPLFCSGCTHRVDSEAL